MTSPLRSQKDKDQAHVKLWESALSAGVLAAQNAVVANSDDQLGTWLVTIRDGRRAFARWIVENDHGYRYASGGVGIFALEPTGSAVRSEAQGRAIAQVLMSASILATVRPHLL